MAVGATFILFLAPTVYYAAEVANKRSREEGQGEVARTTPWMAHRPA